MLDPLRLQRLFDTLKEIHSIHDPAQLWRHVLEKSCQSLQAEGGSFFVVGADQRLMLAAAVGVDEERLRSIPMRVGMGICGWVAEHQEPVVIDQARGDQRFNPIVDEVTGKTTRSILCIPIFSQTQTHGVLELVNRINGPFTADDQEFMTVIGQQTSIAYQNLLLIQETSETKVLLESLMLNMSGGLIAINAEGAVTILNPAAQQLLKLSETEPVGKPAAAALMDYPVIFNVLRQTLAQKTTVSRQEKEIIVQGAPCRFGYSTILISNPQRQVLGSGIIFQRLG